MSNMNIQPCQSHAAGTRPFVGEEWDRVRWFEWASTLLAMQWEGAQQATTPEWCEWDDFRAEWFRALFVGGKECGFVVYEKR